VSKVRGESAREIRRWSGLALSEAAARRRPGAGGVRSAHRGRGLRGRHGAGRIDQMRKSNRHTRLAHILSRSPLAWAKKRRRRHGGCRRRRRSPSVDGAPKRRTAAEPPCCRLGHKPAVKHFALPQKFHQPPNINFTPENSIRLIFGPRLDYFACAHHQSPDVHVKHPLLHRGLILCYCFSM